MAITNPYDADVQARLARALGPAYEIRGVLGRGGFAIVFAALERRLKRDVAVKVLRPDVGATLVMRQRFRREAEAVARLRHPHIVPIYGVAEADDADLVWYVMPLITGPSLRARLERERLLPIDEARRIVLEASAALAVAHRAGIVHRDIKPDNILLDGDDARVLLTDFGIARAMDAPAGQSLTQSGVVIGTPQYMSPEQAAGEPTDARSDIYSLGVVAYQMLAGELPFEAPTVAAQLMRQLVAEAPSVLRKRPDCPSDLAAAVMRCMAKAPDQRWTSVDDLQRALAPVPRTAAAPRSSGARIVASPAPLTQFRRALTIASVAVAASLIVDLARGQVLFGPLALLVGSFAVAISYGRLWVAGYDWRDALRPLSVRGPSRSPVPLDSAEYGPHVGAIQQARSDRAALRATLERIPRSGRGPYEAAVRIADALLAQSAEVARQLVALERQLAPGLDEIERRLAGAESEPQSPGRAQRVAVLERRRDAVRGLIARRDAEAATLSQRLTALAHLRAAVEQGPDAIRAVVSGAEA